MHVDGNWQKRLGRGPFGQLGDDLGLFSVICGQMRISVAKQGSLWVSGGSFWVSGAQWGAIGAQWGLVWVIRAQ